MAITLTFPPFQRRYHLVKRTVDRDAYNNLISLLKELNIKAAVYHPAAIYVPGIY